MHTVGVVALDAAAAAAIALGALVAGEVDDEG